MNDKDHTERKTSPFYDEMVRQIERASRGDVDFSSDGVSTNSDVVQTTMMQKKSNNLFTSEIYAVW